MKIYLVYVGTPRAGIFISWRNLLESLLIFMPYSLLTDNYYVVQSRHFNIKNVNFEIEKLCCQ